MTQGWVTLEKALELDPDFLTRRGQNAWTYDPERHGFYSRFGFSEVRVQLKQSAWGKSFSEFTPEDLDFERGAYGEADNINAVVWGYDQDGNIRVGVTIQARPFADNADHTPANPSIVFGQPCVMGFNIERVAGTDAAVREASEEAGTGTAVLGVESLGYHNPNPTFCATWSELYSIQVDLTKVTAQTDRSELIYRAEYVPIWDLLLRIAEGEVEGVNYRSATANDAFLVWLACHPVHLTESKGGYKKILR